jgi:hypothetical protein
VRATRGVGVNRIGKNDGSDPLVAGEYSNRFATGGENASIDGLPLTSPPYAVLTAIDLNRGDGSRGGFHSAKGTRRCGTIRG